MTLKRNFLIGEEWLFYKIYTGKKIAEEILIKIILPMTKELTAKGIINKWFFIRYHDPQFHLRIRFQINNELFYEVIKLMKEYLSEYFEDLIIFSVQIDTYKREIERYGKITIEEAETLFYYDSIMVSETANLIRGKDSEELRWKFAIMAVDNFFSDFGLSSNSKSLMFEELVKNFDYEFSVNKQFKKQLDMKFRSLRPILNSLLSDKKKGLKYLNSLYNLILLKSENTKDIISSILELNAKNKQDVPINKFIISQSHMMLNRIFIVKPRQNEFVIYYLLYKFYKSENARYKNTDRLKS